MRRKLDRLGKYGPSIGLLLLFEAVAVVLWLAKGNRFYLLNFSYIGVCLGLGTALFTAGKGYARHFVQLAVGVLYAAVPGRSFPGEHADRGLLVLSVPRHV